eukprot:1493465-Amphidinium_carterae.1
MGLACNLKLYIKANALSAGGASQGLVAALSQSYCSQELAQATGRDMLSVALDGGCVVEQVAGEPQTSLIVDEQEDHLFT